MENDEELTAVMEANPAELSYEQARDGLLKVVRQLERAWGKLDHQRSS